MKKFLDAVKKRSKAVASAAFLMAATLVFQQGESHAAGATLTEPTMPDSTSVMQRMVDSFGTAGTYAIVVIGAAVALGIIVILGMYTWRLLKKWLSSAK
ncbi:hypothetical protein ACTID9_28710 (plasmid) [Brevibacillus fluminis]|uniref:hypothetical protein n=1 Tax=Brevibacillus fluminis TaxID=511487 RepID=UPI003F8CB4E3